jgi:homoserine dehydrogenase
LNEHKIALLGFGNVLRNFAQLLLDKEAHLQEKFDTRLIVTGIITNSKGYAIDPDGLDVSQALSLVSDGKKLNELHKGEEIEGAIQFIQTVPAEVILEATWLDPQTGQPATDFCEIALHAGKHVVTANKGPVAFAYERLRDLAADNGLGFFYESTVMDGSPLHAIGREALLGLEIKKIRGILNSTTNYILTRMEAGIEFHQALKEMQEAGLAETDPTNDVDGWDSSVKILVLAKVLMGASDLTVNDVDRVGIRHITVEDCRTAFEEGKRIKLVCEAVKENGEVKLSVKPQPLPLSDSLTSANRTSAIVSIETDVLPEVTLLQGDSSPRTTAYGMLVDTLNILRGRR